MCVCVCVYVYVQKYEMPTRSVGHATQLTSTQEHLSRSAVVPLAEEFLDAECKLRPIPTSLNVPGLLGATGSQYVAFFWHLLLDIHVTQ